MIQPFGDRVAVEVVSEDEQTPGGVYLPEQARDVPRQGKVVAVGPGALHVGGGDWTRVPMPCEEGDTVLFSQYAGTRVELDGTEVLVLREGDLLARMIED
jgi:chaperonin GroES